MALFRRFTNLFRRSRLDRDIDAELQSHIDLFIEDKTRQGMPHAVAKREALLRFGNPTSTRERVAAADTTLSLENFVRDLRYALRQLRRSPGFALTAILTLALGIGACVCIFSFADAALIKPLPYQDPARLVAVFESMSLGPQFHISYLDYLDWKKQNQVFSSLDIYDGSNLTLTTASGLQTATGATVSDGFFRTLGVTPALGRDFTPGEDLPGAPHNVILSYAAWQNRFGSRTSALGQSITLNGIAYTVIGVLPRAFHFVPTEPADFWITLHTDNPCGKERGCHNYSGIARLKNGVSLLTAAAQMRAIADHLAQQYPVADASRSATVLPLSDLIIGKLRPILITLLAGALLLLLIASTNVASLLLVRAESRKREIAVRGAMGASLLRLLQQLISEGFVLAFSSVLIGLASAQIAIQLLLRLIPDGILATMPYLRGLGLNLHVLAFAGALASLSTLLFCLIPAARLSLSSAGAGLRNALASGGRGFSGTLWRRFGSHLIAIELAMAVVLLVAAGLLGKSFYRMLHAPIGLNPDHVASLRIGLSSARYPKAENIHALELQLSEKASALPGIESVGLTARLPVGISSGSTTFHVIGRPEHDDHVEVLNREVDPGYFPTIGAQIVRGRGFTRHDDAAAPLVLLINQAMAKEFFPNQDPIGKRIAFDPNTNTPSIEIVGIVENIKEGPLDTAARPALYSPLAQSDDDRFYVVVRSALPEQEILPLLGAAAHSIDPSLTLSEPTSMSQRIHDSPAASLHRSSAWIVGGFAGIALLLGAVGLYGVISYSVGQRTREIGVRLALGAQREAVYRLILREAGWLTAIGIVLGLVCSLLTAISMRSLLFDVQAWDTSILASVAVVLAATALLASFLPAHRAARVDPMQALRSE